MSDDTARQAQPESARRWRDDLESWAIPPEILAAAPETPWGCPTALFARSTEETVAAGGGLTAGGQPSPSFRRAREVLRHSEILIVRETAPTGETSVVPMRRHPVKRRAASSTADAVQDLAAAGRLPE